MSSHRGHALLCALRQAQPLLAASVGAHQRRVGGNSGACRENAVAPRATAHCVRQQLQCARACPEPRPRVVWED
jgi:hypothetical protein